MNNNIDIHVNHEIELNIKDANNQDVDWYHEESSKYTDVLIQLSSCMVTHEEFEMVEALRECRVFGTRQLEAQLIPNIVPIESIIKRLRNYSQQDLKLLISNAVDHIITDEIPF